MNIEDLKKEFNSRLAILKADIRSLQELVMQLDGHGDEDTPEFTRWSYEFAMTLDEGDRVRLHPDSMLLLVEANWLTKEQAIETNNILTVSRIDGWDTHQPVRFATSSGEPVWPRIDEDIIRMIRI